jgi:hypothetical protein
METMYLYPDKPPVLGANNSDSEDQLIRFLQSEDEYSFVRTGEAVHILAQCLRNLRHTISLSSLIYRAEKFDVIGQTAVLRALEVSRYPRKLAEVYIYLNAIREPGWSRFAESLSEFQSYLKGALFDTPETLFLNKRNKTGSHVQGFRLSHSDLREVMTATKDVEHLEICGCAFQPFLRLCHGCQDLFATHFAPAPYAYLSRLRLTCFYVSGGRLRRSIKHHSATLHSFEASWTFLTDGSWNSIFQGLRKLESLNYLELHDVQQKHGPMDVPALPATYRCDYLFDLGINVSNEGVQLFLSEIIRYFNVGLGGTVCGPQYHVVCLFHVPKVAGVARCKDPLQVYAEEVEG